MRRPLAHHAAANFGAFAKAPEARFRRSHRNGIPYSGARRVGCHQAQTRYQGPSLYDKQANWRYQMIRCVRLWSGEDQNSHFQEGTLDLEAGQRGDLLSGKLGAITVSFQETAQGGAFAWHTAPARQ